MLLLHLSTKSTPNVYEVLISMIESCKREDDLREYLREKLLNLLEGLPSSLQLAGVSCKCFFAGKY